jgi:hypothetical protein
MLSWYLIEERQKERVRDLERSLILREALSAQVRGHRSAEVLVWLGYRLVAAGTRLLASKGRQVPQIPPTVAIHVCPPATTQWL